MTSNNKMNAAMNTLANVVAKRSRRSSSICCRADGGEDDGGSRSRSVNLPSSPGRCNRQTGYSSSYYYDTNNESTVHPRQPPPSSSVAAIASKASAVTAMRIIGVESRARRSSPCRGRQLPSEAVWQSECFVGGGKLLALRRLQVGLVGVEGGGQVLGDRGFAGRVCVAH